MAPVDAIPFADASFDLVALNDVLQHVDERAVAASLGELRRVLKEGGALLVRTNGGRRARREREDWRLYDESLLREQLEAAGFRVERLTHANGVLSAWGAIRGKGPTAPTGTTCGIPSSPGALVNTIGSWLLGLEARYLRSPGRRLGFGHTLFAVATPGGPVTQGVQAFFDATSSDVRPRVRQWRVEGAGAAAPRGGRPSPCSASGRETCSMPAWEAACCSPSSIAAAGG